MDVVMPQLGETVAEGTVTKWYKKVGDAIKADEALFDVETDKVSTEIPAQANGVLAEILIAEGVTAKVGAKLAVIREAVGARSAEPSAASRQPSVTTQATAVPAASVAVRAVKADADERLSPVVRRLLAEHTLDPAAIAGTGRDGRITREDVIAHIERRGAPGLRARNPLPSPAARAGSWSTTSPCARRCACARC
jgi:2-oxoglutarate dehydrogenase E2 component (dihydrolipoamide succinyltransferase)